MKKKLTEESNLNDLIINTEENYNNNVYITTENDDEDLFNEILFKKILPEDINLKIYIKYNNNIVKIKNEYIFSGISQLKNEISRKLNSEANEIQLFFEKKK